MTEDIIVKAAKEYADKHEYTEGTIGDLVYFGNDVAAAFASGAEWYRMNVWHAASEMPNVAEIPLYKDKKVKDKIGCPLRCCVIILDDLRHISIYSDNLYDEKDWEKYYVEAYGFKKWAYARDILGEKDKPL
mgnify:CR=1 FL=1